MVAVAIVVVVVYVAAAIFCVFGTLFAVDTFGAKNTSALPIKSHSSVISFKQVRTSLYVSYLGHIDDEQLEFETHIILRHRWRDPRLQFANNTGVGALEGEAWFADNIWTPTIFIENEEVIRQMAE